MTFLDASFLLVFLPSVGLLYWLACGRYPLLAVAILPVAAIVFLALNDLRALWFVVASVILNYLLVRGMQRCPPGGGRKWLLALGIAGNLAPLVVFKFALLSDIGIMSVAGDGVAGAGGGAMPLGMAFYTLAQITFLMDATQPKTPHLGMIRYAAWASMFCQLPAGPIAPYKKMAPQYAVLGHARPLGRDLACGMSLFVAGMFKKLVIADQLAGQIAPLYTASHAFTLSAVETFAAAWGFLLQLYFDFSSYSDMAIGLALCFGLRLPVNFNSPLKARSFGDYVLRWHISLTYFVRDYVFLPVFRLLDRYLRKKASLAAWGGATIISFLAVGAWHSPATPVLLISLLVGMIAVGAQAYRVRIAATTSVTATATGATAARNGGTGAVNPVMTIVSPVFSRGLALGMAALVAMIFRSEGTDSLHHLLAGFGAVHLPVSGAADMAKLAVVLLGGSVIALLAPNTMQIFGFVRAERKAAHSVAGYRRFIQSVSLRFSALIWRPGAVWAGVIAAMLVVSILFMTKLNSAQDFIYARF